MDHTSIIKIDGYAALSAALPVRRLVYMVLLLAVKDRATEIRFEPSTPDREWKLRYNVYHTWYEMVPVPLHVPISQEIRRLAGPGLARRLVRYLGRLVPDTTRAQEEHVRLLMAGHAVDLRLTFEPARVGSPSDAEIAVLRLPVGVLPSEEAQRILSEYFQNRPSPPAS